MTTITTNINTIDDTYNFECACGEHYASVEDARRCRKCWTYAPEGWCDEVIDTRHGGTVWEPRVDWDVELEGALDKPRTFAPTLADVWPTAA